MIPTVSTSSMNTSTVLDLGSFAIKAGESTDTRPAHQIYSYSAYNAENSQSYPQEHLLYSSQSRPFIQNGQIIDFDLLEQKLSNLNKQYYPNMFSCVSVLQPYFTPVQERNKLAELLFEKFGARAVYFGSQESCSCFGAGTPTGVVCDFGYGVTKTCPVVDGHVLESQGSVCYLNGEVIGQLIQNEVCAEQKVSQYYQKQSDFQKILLNNDLMQYFCTVSEQPIDPLTFEFTNTQMFQLPDNTQIELNKSSQLIPEIFFQTNIIHQYDKNNFQFNSIQYQFLQSIINQPAQVRRELVNNIVMCGGVSNVQNLQNRFRSELECVFAVQALTGKPRFTSLQIPKQDLTFFGGAVVSSLGIFGYLVSSAQEWKEEGMVGVERRRM